MKNLKSILVITMAAIVIQSCTKDDPDLLVPASNDAVESALKAAKPLANLKGDFKINFVYVPGSAGPTWDGEVSFEGLAGKFGFRFFPLGSEHKGQSFHFTERFELYDLNDPEHVLLWGLDKGISAPEFMAPEPTKFRILGMVVMAEDPFAAWVDRKVNIKGIVNFQVNPYPVGPENLPDYCTGEFRFN